MGEPSLFWVGGTQAKVRLDGVTALGGGGVGVGGDVVVLVLEPLAVDVPLALSVAVVDVVELALVSLATALAAAPWLSSPQPASASARLPTKVAITTRSALIARSACLIATPDRHSHTGQARGEVTNRGCTSGTLWVQLALTHEAVRLAPATPLS